jgi:D-alanyl-D-alanine dipeptidase
MFFDASGVYAGGMRERIAKAAAVMKSVGVEALVLTPGADLFYLTGFEHGHAGERLLALVLRADGKARWIAPAMNVPQVEKRAEAGETIRGWNDTEWYLTPLKEALAGVKSVAFDEEARAGFVMDLMEVARPQKLVPSSVILRGMRIRKDAAEIGMLKRVARQVDDTIAEAVKFCVAGRSEGEVDEMLKAALLKKDAESAIAFTIIASGENSALPHHETGKRVMTRGDVVILDFGTRGAVPVGGEHSHIYGYQSDITVTCSIGEPADAEARNVYGIVYAAQQAAIRAVKPGTRCEEIDAAARDVIESAAYGKYFMHRTGHGLGLSGHEPPYLRTGNEETLEEGMVFSIEPGIYLPGRFGVRLEIIATVTADGVELINRGSAAELLVA